jgi:mitogen-activated protein kinase kinase kinase 1
VLLSYASCNSKRQLEELQELIRPIIRILLLRCTDRNHNTAHLSAEILVELSKGQNGELALGKHVVDNPNTRGLEGLELVLGCVLEDWSFDTVSWEWLAGRLIILDRLIQDFPNEFWLQYVPLYPNDSGYKLHNYNRLITIVEFSFKALRSPNSTVAKLARHVFVISSSMTAKERGVFNQVLEMLSSLDPNLQTRLRKRLHQAATESGSQSQAAGYGSKKVKAGHCVMGERCHSQRVPQHGRSSPLHTSHNAVAKSLLPSNVLNVPCQAGLRPGSGTSLPRPKYLPLDISNVKNKKPVRFQHLPCISPIQISSPKRWSGPGSKLLSLFTNKKHGELLPTKPELNGIYRDTSSPVGQVCENCSVGNCQRHMDLRHSHFGSLYSKVMTPTTPPAPHTTPVQEMHRSSSQTEEFLNEVSEELVIPLDLSNLKSEFESEIPSIPGLNSPLVLDVSAVHPHDKVFPTFLLFQFYKRYGCRIPTNLHLSLQNMEGGVKCSSYLEGLDWKRGHLLGTGAFSSCYQARDVATGTLMAVKQVFIVFCCIE